MEMEEISVSEVHKHASCVVEWTTSFLGSPPKKSLILGNLYIHMYVSVSVWLCATSPIVGWDKSVTTSPQGVKGDNDEDNIFDIVDLEGPFFVDSKLVNYLLTSKEMNILSCIIYLLLIILNISAKIWSVCC